MGNVHTIYILHAISVRNDIAVLIPIQAINVNNRVQFMPQKSISCSITEFKKELAKSSIPNASLNSNGSLYVPGGVKRLHSSRYTIITKVVNSNEEPLGYRLIDRNNLAISFHSEQEVVSIETMRPGTISNAFVVEKKFLRLANNVSVPTQKVHMEGNKTVNKNGRAYY